MTDEAIIIDPTQLDNLTRPLLENIIYLSPSPTALYKGTYFLPTGNSTEPYLTVKLTHSLIPRPSSKNPFFMRWEVAGELLNSGSSGFVYRDLGVLKAENNFNFTPHVGDKENIIKEIILKKNDDYKVKPKTVWREKVKINECSDFFRCKVGFFSQSRGYLIMRKAPGVELLDFINLMYEGKIQVSPLELLKISRAILVEIHNLHKRGKVHRDIKPCNIMIDPETHEVKLIDFAFVKPIKRNNTHSRAKGTCAYLAPEIPYKNKISTAGDWFAAGWTIAQLLGEQGLNNIVQTSHFPQQINKLLTFFRQQQFNGMFTSLNLNIPSEISQETLNILHGLTRFDDQERLRGYQAIARFDRLIQNYESMHTLSCTAV